MRKQKQSFVSNQLDIPNAKSLHAIKPGVLKKIFLLIGFILIGFGVLLLIRKIENKKFSVRVTSADEVKFKIVGEDSFRKSPLCNCPNPLLNNYGFLQCFKNIDIDNKSDTTSFSITAPSPDNPSALPSYKFNVEFYLFEKPAFQTQDPDSVLSGSTTYFKKLNLIKKIKLGVFFISIINNGKLRSVFQSENVISSFLPGTGSGVVMQKKYEKYSRQVSSINLQYSAEYRSHQESDNNFIEFFGPGISFYFENVYDVLYEKGAVLDEISKGINSLYKNTFALMIVDVPFKARLTTCNWNSFKTNTWHSELIKNRFGKYRPAGFLNHMPWIFLDDGSLYDFRNDDKALYLPPYYPDRLYNIDINFRNPLHDTAYSLLKERCLHGSRIFGNDNFRNGIVFWGITPIEPKVPGNLSKEFIKSLNDVKHDTGFLEAKKIGAIFKQAIDKYGVDTLAPLYGEGAHVLFYYPELPEFNSIYYYGNLTNIQFENAAMIYSYGLTAKQEYENCSLELNDISINDTAPFYSQMPLNYSERAKEAGLSLTTTSAIYVNNEKVGDHFIDRPIFRGLSTIFGILGIGIISIFSYFRRFFNLKK